MPVTPATTTVNAYLDAFYAGRIADARALLADDFAFKGPFAEVRGKDAFFAAASRLAPIVRGHSLVRQWIDGDDVASLYEAALETPRTSGRILLFEWNRVAEGLVQSARLVFDTPEFRAVVPG